jgi:hypothetical protein
MLLLLLLLARRGRRRVTKRERGGRRRIRRVVSGFSDDAGWSVSLLAVCVCVRDAGFHRGGMEGRRPLAGAVVGVRWW